MLAIVAAFLTVAARFYVPGKGLTPLIQFGEKLSDRFIPELKVLPYYSVKQTYGYDAQWYVQIAIRPDPRDPEMASSVDNLEYRARRILFCWVAYVAGLGKPWWIVQAYALINIVSWLVLAWLTLRWFPPTRWENVLRWAAVMLSFGLCFSARFSLVDGPSLLLIAAGVALFEKGRKWSSALVLGIAGLGKETNVLSAASFGWPKGNSVRAWLSLSLRCALVVAPILIWSYVLHRIFAGVNSGSAGARAFDFPLHAYWMKLRQTFVELSSGQGDAALPRGNLYRMIALTVQLAFLVARPRFKEVWWRVGAAYAVLMIFLGEAVWEGYPDAASRVLLPMTLAFNILLPRGRAWLPLLILGNLSVLTTFDLARPPESLGYTLKAPVELTEPTAGGDSLTVQFGEGWYAPERSTSEYWLWSKGHSRLFIYNPTSQSLVLSADFSLKANARREVVFGADQGKLWSGEIGENRQQVHVDNIILVPGPNQLWWKTAGEVAAAPVQGDTRNLVFSLRNLKLTVRPYAGPRKN